MARGEITVPQTLVFSGVIGGLGMWTLFNFVNPLTMWLTFATFVGYAVIYTIILSCRRRGINPQEYLTDVLQRLPAMKNTEVKELVPGRWKPKAPQAK